MRSASAVEGAKVLFWLLTPVSLLLLFLGAQRWGRSAPAQPVTFDHALHAAQKIGCTDCHSLVEKSEHAGLPTANLCMTCHQVIKSDSPEVKKIAAFQQSRQAIPWVRLYEVPHFVYFNHSRHIKAGMKCGECHGNTGTVAVSATEKEFTMATCVDCHTERKASNDCLTCHK